MILSLSSLPFLPLFNNLRIKEKKCFLLLFRYVFSIISYCEDVEVLGHNRFKDNRAGEYVLTPGNLG